MNLMAKILVLVIRDMIFSYFWVGGVGVREREGRNNHMVNALFPRIENEVARRDSRAGWYRILHQPSIFFSVPFLTFGVRRSGTEADQVGV